MGFGSALGSLWQGATDGAKAAARAVSSGAATAWHATSSAVEQGWEAARDTAAKGATAVAGAVDHAWDATKAKAAAAWDGAKAKAAEVWGATKGAAARAWDATTDAVATAWDATKDAAVAARNTAMAAAFGATAAVSDAAEAAFRKAKEVFGPRLIGQPIEPCPTSVAGKVERSAERRLLIGDARYEAAALPPASRKGLLATAARFERDIQAVEHARLAGDVYDTKGDPPLGWTRLSDDPATVAKLGLRQEDFAPGDSDFRAALYRSELTGETVLAFKGTTSGADWGTNLSQGLGQDTDYYNRAMNLARRVKHATPGPLSITGHSLGGGLASAASAVTGVPADTFNAAGLHPGTIAKYNVDRKTAGEHIEAYRVEGEVLSTIQNGKVQGVAVAATGILAGAPAVTGAYLGARAGSGAPPLAWDAVGRPHTLPAVDDQGRSWFVDDLRLIDKHLMPRVINGLEKQKADDQKALATALGRR